MQSTTLTRLSSKGQVIIPQSIRRTWRLENGQKFIIEETDKGILLRPVKPVVFAKTTLQQAAGCLQSAYTGKPKTLEEMEAAIRQGIEAQYGRS